MKFKFEKLIIWQKAIEYGENINKLSYKFPKEEMYNLSSHIRKAVDSIALNISEGSIGQSNPEFKKLHGLMQFVLWPRLSLVYTKLLKENIFLKKNSMSITNMHSI